MIPKPIGKALTAQFGEMKGSLMNYPQTKFVFEKFVGQGRNASVNDRVKRLTLYLPPQIDGNFCEMSVNDKGGSKER